MHVRKVYLRHGGGGTSATATDPNLKIRCNWTFPKRLSISGRVIVDSGTTDTYFSRKLGTVFKKAFKEMTGEEYTHSVQKVYARAIGTATDHSVPTCRVTKN